MHMNQVEEDVHDVAADTCRWFGGEPVEVASMESWLDKLQQVLHLQLDILMEYLFVQLDQLLLKLLQVKSVSASQIQTLNIPH